MQEWWRSENAFTLWPCKPKNPAHTASWNDCRNYWAWYDSDLVSSSFHEWPMMLADACITVTDILRITRISLNSVVLGQSYWALRMNELGEMSVNALSLPWKKNCDVPAKSPCEEAAGSDRRISVGASWYRNVNKCWTLNMSVCWDIASERLRIIDSNSYKLLLYSLQFTHTVELDLCTHFAVGR